MEREYEYLLEILDAFLQNRKPRDPENVNWENLVQLSQIHCVTGILGYMAMRHPICTDPQLQESLRHVCLTTIALFTQRGEMMKELIGKLERAGIPHILMKGYVIRDYYPVPELRTFGDIDFVIPAEHRQRCHEMMLADGFQLETDWEPVFSYSRGTEFYEIHTDIMEVDVSEKADYRSYFRNMWQHAQPAEGCSYRFTPEYHFLYLLTHIAKHIHGAGAGARMYLDIAVFLQHFEGKLDWNYLRQELEALQLFRFCSVVLTAVERWFSIKAPIRFDPVEQDVMDRFQTFTMEAGVFGHFNRELGVNALKNAEQVQQPSRLTVLRRMVFPSAKQIDKRYTYLQKHPWLLPAAWVHRLVKNRGVLGDRAHDAQVILSADMDEVQRLQQINREIGL